MKKLAPSFIVLCVFAFTTFQSFSQTATYNTAGTFTFTVPAGVTSITVECWGAGGRGGARTAGNNIPLAGGGGGAYSRSTLTVTPYSSFAVVVGAGATTTAAGGSSSFGGISTVLAVGGGSVADNSNTPGSGGLASAGVGTTRFDGGNGATGTGGNFGGGGGSSAGTALAGNYTNLTTNIRNGATAPAGGGNGGLGANLTTAGAVGTVAGGGGGGGFRNAALTQAPGNGAAGTVIVTYTVGGTTTYFSKATGDWNVNTTWTTSPTHTGANAGPPTATDAVVIGSGHTVDTNNGNRSCLDLTIVGAGILDIPNNNNTVTVSGNFRMDGTSQVTGNAATRTVNVQGNFTVPSTATNARISGQTVTVTGTTTIDGSLIFNNATGLKTFTNTVTVNTGGVWNASTGNPATSFGGGIDMDGTTFNNGTGAAAFSANQSLTGASNMTFGGTITPAVGTTLTNSNTGTVTVSGTGSIVLTGNFTQGLNSNLSLAAVAPFSGAGTFNASTNTNLVTYTGASPAIRATTYSSLTINGSGTSTVGGATTVDATMTVTSAVTNNSTLTVTTALSGGSTLTQGAGATLNIGGTSTITGLTATAATNTVNYTGTAQTIKTPTTNTYLNLGLSGSGNKTFAAALTISGNLSITGAVADLGAITTHTANSLTLGGIGQLSGTHGSTASTATYRNNTYFLSSSTGRITIATCTAPSSGTATTYYSRNATLGGNWNDNNSWTTSSDGTGGPLAAGVWPRAYDHVVIRSGHTITIDAITDNSYCGISPDGLANALIGAGGGTGFNGSNVAMFYQTGDIAISGTLTVIAGVNMMVAGYTRIASTGTFSLTSYLVNTGYLEADASSTFTTLDDLSLTGTSTTIINTNSTSADDLNIDHTIATLCGTGTQGLLNSGGSAINYTNSATVAQICTSFTVTCSGGGCAGFPVVGTTSVILGNVGPGGVGNSSSNRMWFRANDLGLANGAAVSTWGDVSGNSLSAAATLTERPTFVTNSVNGFPSISFDGSNDYLNLGTPAGLNFVPGTHSWSFVAVYSAPTNGFSTTPNQGTLFAKAYNTPDTRNFHYQVDDTPGPAVTFASYIGNALNGGGPTVNTGAFFVSSHTNNTTTKTSFTNETSNFAAIPIAVGSDLTTHVLIGARRTTATAGTGFLYTGNIAELMMYNGELNAAQRIIVTDYLAAKYAITLSANDFHTMDNGANGDYDYEVAGIGQAAADGSNHKDAKGSGIVRMWNPNGLANGEFLLWGHDNATLASSTTAVGLTGVDGTIVRERLVRRWRVSEIGGDVGTVSISFDLSPFPASMGSNLRLLIDRDGDGFGDNDVTPVAGSLIGSTIVFSGVNFQSGDRFTLGNIDLSTPLPIELLTFSGTPKSDKVVLNWSTASELNNDYFTVERSSGGEIFSSIGQVKGGGTTSHSNKYEMIDHNPINGTAYYRLKQTDFDGTFTYSKIIDVNYEGSTVATMDVFPNPTRGEFTIRISGIKNMESVPVVMYDQLGREYMRLVLNVDENSGVASKTFTPEHKLPQGMYLLKAGHSPNLTVRFSITGK